MRKVRELFRVRAILCGIVVACIGSIAPAIADPVFGAGTFVCITAPGEFCRQGKTFSNFNNTSPTALLFGSINNGLTSDSIAGSRLEFLPNCSGFCGVTASGNGSADLATGTLKAYATSSGRYLKPNTIPTELAPYLATISQAGFEETLTATENGVMHFNINVSGTVTIPDPPFICTNCTYPTSEVSGGVSFHVNGAYYIGTNGEFNADGCIAAGGCVYEFDFPVSVGTAIDFTLVLEVDAADSTADFSHTLSLAVTGVSFTSDSGVFPSAAEPPAPAPEPGTLALLGIATAGLVWRRRRQ